MSTSKTFWRLQREASKGIESKTRSYCNIRAQHSFIGNHYLPLPTNIRPTRLAKQLGPHACHRKMTGQARPSKCWEVPNGETEWQNVRWFLLLTVSLHLSALAWHAKTWPPRGCKNCMVSATNFEDLGVWGGPTSGY